jgi:hypothetical protein
MHFGRPFTDADGKDSANLCFSRAAKHRLAIICVARAVEVGVRVD